MAAHTVAGFLFLQGGGVGGGEGANNGPFKYIVTFCWRVGGVPGGGEVWGWGAISNAVSAYGNA
jgi:hypothetical protein